MKNSTKVLIVEDDKYIQRAYQAGLKDSGFEVDITSDGEKGLAELTKKKHDIVILDLILPNVNGFEFLINKRADKEIKDIPVIIVSNLSEDTDTKKGMEFGAVEYLTKTNVTLENIIETIKKHVKK